MKNILNNLIKSEGINIVKKGVAEDFKLMVKLLNDPLSLEFLYCIDNFGDMTPYFLSTINKQNGVHLIKMQYIHMRDYLLQKNIIQEKTFDDPETSDEEDSFELRKKVPMTRKMVQHSSEPEYKEISGISIPQQEKITVTSMARSKYYHFTDRGESIFKETADVILEILQNHYGYQFFANEMRRWNEIYEIVKQREEKIDSKVAQKEDKDKELEKKKKHALEVYKKIKPIVSEIRKAFYEKAEHEIKKYSLNNSDELLKKLRPTIEEDIKEKVKEGEVSLAREIILKKLPPIYTNYLKY